MRSYLLYFLVLPILLFSSCGIPEHKIPYTKTRTIQDAQLELAELEKHISAENVITTNSFHMQNFKTLLRQARYIVFHYKPSETVLKKLSTILDHAHVEKQLASVKKQNGIITGLLTEGYYDSCDDSFQPFLRYLPKSALKGKKIPLIVFLHGYSPSLNIVNWGYFPEKLIEFAEEHGFALAAPFGRSNTDYQSIGERDVMRVIEEMQKRYLINSEKIILSGISMGGMGAWTIAGHNPDKFAGILIISGRGDYYFWQNISSNDIPSYKRMLINAEFPITMLSNFAHIPIVCVHGSADSVIPVEEARHIAKIMQNINPTFQYIEIENADHWIFDDVFARSDIRQWLLSRKREVPEKFRFVIHHSKNASCYGITALPFLPLIEPAELGFEIINDTLLLSAKNIESVIVCRELLPRKFRKLKIANKEKTILRIVKGKNDIPPLSPVGPVKNAFLEPFVFVCTAAPEDEEGMRYFNQRCYEWYRYAKAEPRKMYESSLDFNKLSQYNVFVFGEPEKSILARKILENAPIKVDGEYFIIGKERITREGHGLFLVYKSPWNPQKLAILQCGIAWGEELPENHKYDFLPDYIIYSREIESDGCNKALYAGFFTTDWHIK